MQLHRVWHEGTLGQAIKTEFYTEDNAKIMDGVMIFHNAAARKALTIPLAKILWMESEYV